MRDWLIYRTFWELTVSGLVLGLIYSLVALGYTMVYGIIGMVNFAHGDVLMASAFVAWGLIVGLGLPFWLAGGYGSAEKLKEALAEGAAGIQVGTAFAFCDEFHIEISDHHAFAFA